MSSRARWTGGAVGFVVVLVIGYLLAAMLIPRSHTADSDKTATNAGNGEQNNYVEPTLREEGHTLVARDMPNCQVTSCYLGTVQRFALSGHRVLAAKSVAFRPSYNL